MLSLLRQYSRLHKRPKRFRCVYRTLRQQNQPGQNVLDSDTIQLPKNNSDIAMHGGPKGWQYQVYEANPIDETTLELTRFSPDGDANFRAT